jgi:heptose I phosphotransferase
MAIWTHPLFLLIVGSLALGMAMFVRAVRRAGRRAFVAWHPIYRDFLREQGLTGPDAFLALPTIILSGHPDRQVGRVTMGSRAKPLSAFLKREFRVHWTVRLANFLSGFGLASRSLREAHTLQALRREGLPGPEWLAAGEDGRGQAFLLVREAEGARGLPALLQSANDPTERRRLAWRLGATLARLHDAGFEHRDLYAKHVVIEPENGDVMLVDWQRARRQGFLGLRARVRDLAALHATVGEGQARPRERLACLMGYWRTGCDWRGDRRTFLRAVEAWAQRRLARRHVREKRQPPPAELQAWVCLDGEALCVTPALHELCPEAAGWLALDNQPAPAAGRVRRQWVALAENHRALLVRRQETPTLAERMNQWLGRGLASPEHRQAGLLFRLHRHGIEAPRLLAMGQRGSKSGSIDSFLLTEPAAEATQLRTWLARHRQGADRQAVLKQLGALVQRLHQATCYLQGPDLPVVVRQDGDQEPTAILEGVESLQARRRLSASHARRDVKQVKTLLTAAGCSASELQMFLESYEPSRRPSAAESFPPRPIVAAAATRQEDCSVKSTLWQRLWHGVRRVRHQPDWPRLAGAQWDDAIMHTAVTDRFHAKQGRSVGRWRLTDPIQPTHGLTVYLKRHYQLPWWQGLLATIWPGGDWSPAMQEWRHLEWARRQGLPVPAATAAGEWIGPRFKLQSFLAVEELTDMLALHEAIPEASKRQDDLSFRRWKRGLVAEMARLSRMLHDRRCFHKDLYLCHFYIHRDFLDRPPPGPEGWRGRVFMIDLHRLGHHPWTWRIWQLKDLAQLLYSSEVVGIDARDQVCFWRHYRGLGPRRESDRWLRRWVVMKWKRYRQHNLRRKARLRQEVGEVVSIGGK